MKKMPYMLDDIDTEEALSPESGTSYPFYASTNEAADNEKKAAVESYLKKKYDAAADAGNVNDAKDTSRYVDMAATFGQGLESLGNANGERMQYMNRFQDMGKIAPTTSPLEMKHNWDGVRKAGDKQLAQAEADRKRSIDSFLMQDKLEQEDKERSRGDKKWGRQEADWVRQDAFAAAEGDADSEVSKHYQALAQKMMPGRDFSSLSAAQLKNSLPVLEKMYAVDAKNREQRSEVGRFRLDGEGRLFDSVTGKYVRGGAPNSPYNQETPLEDRYMSVNGRVFDRKTETFLEPKTPSQPLVVAPDKLQPKAGRYKMDARGNVLDMATGNVVKEAEKLPSNAPAQAAAPKERAPQGKPLTNSGDKARFDNVNMAIKSLEGMEDALVIKDQRTFTLPGEGDNDYTVNRRLWEEAMGRMQSGGAITTEEEARFKAMAPTWTDSADMQRKKLRMMREEMDNRLKTLGQPVPDRKTIESSSPTVKIKAPDGSVRIVPREAAEKYLKKGGKLVE